MASGIVSTRKPSVLVALKPGPGAGPALSAGIALARQVGAEVAAVYIGGTTGAAEASAAAASAGVPLTVVRGPILASLLSEAQRAGVAVLVLASGSQPGKRRPPGRLALAVAAVLSVPVLIVPPACPVPVLFRRLLLPVDEGLAPSVAVSLVRRLVRDQPIEVVLLHVHGTGSIPAFDDQPHYEAQAWERRFRHQVGASLTEMPLQVRVGATSETVLGVAEEVGADLIVLEWDANLGPGRATVVRQVVGRSHVPVLLLRSRGAGQPPHRPSAIEV